MTSSSESSRNLFYLAVLIFVFFMSCGRIAYKTTEDTKIVRIRYHFEKVEEKDSLYYLRFAYGMLGQTVFNYSTNRNEKEVETYCLWDIEKLNQRFLFDTSFTLLKLTPLDTLSSDKVLYRLDSDFIYTHLYFPDEESLFLVFTVEPTRVRFRKRGKEALQSNQNIKSTMALRPFLEIRGIKSIAPTAEKWLSRQGHHETSTNSFYIIAPLTAHCPGS